MAAYNPYWLKGVAQKVEREKDSIFSLLKPESKGCAQSMEVKIPLGGES